MKNFYYNGSIGDEVVLEDEQFVHITKVLRLIENSEITLFNGDGNFYDCVITQVNKKNLVAKVVKKYESERKTKSNITVFQGIIKKPDNQALIVQKMTELGVKKVVFFESEFTNTKLESGPKTRLEKIVIESCKQCGRADLLQLENISKFDNLLENLKNFDLVILAYENERKGDLCEFAKGFYGKNIALIVGSEGGFSQAEVEKMEKIGARVVCLGKTILRAETACIALASATLCILGEWK